jgi:hypothetical protein
MFEGSVLCLVLEGSLEFPDRMRLFYCKSFSATLLREGGNFETNHLGLRWSPVPFCSHDRPLGGALCAAGNFVFNFSQKKDLSHVKIHDRF